MGYIKIDVKKTNEALFFGPNGQVVTNDNCQTHSQASWWWYMGLGLGIVYTMGDNKIVNLRLLA